MTFSSLEFLFLFLPVTLGLYAIAPGRARNGVLLFASLVFYTWGGGAFVIILAVSVFVDYFAGQLVAWARREGRQAHLAAGVALSVSVNLLLLGFFKYANFVVAQINSVGAAFGMGPIAWTNVALPIGISFFTFQSMSYTIDLARGRAEQLRNPLDFALYVALFPQLICGPIVRYHQIAAQIRQRSVGLDGVCEGAARFVHGLVKKVVLADAAGAVADAAFGVPAGQLNAASAWLGVAAYTLQIYFDFSGYSDMAIGLGRLFGFTLPENFRRPYSAISITDFWRRWHMTLSSWLRDYLYIPLGGSRGGPLATYRNLVIVFVLCGLWHGAAWQFLAWGVYHGGLLVIERVTGQRPVGEAPVGWWRRPMVLLLVMLGWVIFRADSLGHAAGFFRALLTFSGSALVPTVADALTHRILVTLVLASAVVWLPRDFVAGPVVASGRGQLAASLRWIVLGLGAPYATALAASSSFSPFLYFQF